MEHRGLFHAIWSSWLRGAKVCNAHGGNIAIEWPSGCEYWRWQNTTNFINKYQLNTVKIIGCAVGLRTDKAGKLCPGKHEHPVHQKVEGKCIKNAEDYNPEMVKMIHRAWKRSVMSRLKSKREDETFIPVMPLDQNHIQMVHRERVPLMDSIFNDMVVRTVKTRN
eukprot:7722218-Heterocapsa_arctica.AAC.1